MRTNMDVLELENFILEKTAQAPLVEEARWREEFVLDCRPRHVAMAHLLQGLREWASPNEYMSYAAS